MRIYSFIFSPTGGTKRVMEILGREFEAVSVVDLCGSVEEMELCAGDLALIGLPSYGGRIPAGVEDRLHKIHGNGAKAVLVAIYGNRAIDDTLIEMKDVAESCGFTVAGAISAVAEHSIMRHVAKGRPDAQDEAQLRDFMSQILAKLDTEREITVPGKRPYKNFGGANMFPIVENCVACGLCAANCPVGAIPADAPHTTDKEKCICCMRCIDNCPVNARQRNSLALNATIQKLAALVSGRKPNTLYI